MKLRIKDNSLRMRLTQTEVAQVGKGEAVSAQISFKVGNPLTYLVSSQEVPTATVIYQDHTIEVALPVAQARAWAASEDVSIEEMIPVGQNHLRLLVEKDFQCLHKRPHEDESDHFANPAAEPVQ